MLPASAVRLPAARSRCATRAVVVDLPLVPVMQTRRPVGGSANHSPLELAKRTHVDAYSVALVYVGLRQYDHALDWLDRACESRGGLFSAWVNSDPRLEGLRSDARFQGILQRARLA